MTTITVTNALAVTLLPPGADRWVTIQHQGGGSLRIKHDATGIDVGSNAGTILKPGEILPLSGAPAAAAITAQAAGGDCTVCVQTGPLA